MAISVVDYVLTRLTEQGVTHLFGVPALYCAALFDAAPAHGIMPVVTASDLEAGYAADGYARTKGLAAVSVANGVGTLSLINAIGGAYVERSPVVVINGGPTAGHLADLAQRDVLYSHSTGRANAELDAFALVTAKSVRAATKDAVPAAVDGAITAALTSKRPVYLEIAMDLWSQTCANPGPPLTSNVQAAGTETQLAATIVGLIRGAQKPVILIGTEVARYGLAEAVADLIAKLGVRWASDMLSKSTLAEKGAGWIGVYDPPYVPQAIRTQVESTDLLVTLGCVYPNSFANLITQKFNSMVAVYDGKVRVKNQPKQSAEIRALVAAMRTKAAEQPPTNVPAGAVPTAPPAATGALTYKQVFQRVGNALDETLITIPDTFLGTYSAANLPVKGKDAFLCDAVWASIGHSVAAAVGASFGSARRPLGHLRRRRVPDDRSGAVDDGAVRTQPHRRADRQRHLRVRAVFVGPHLLQHEQQHACPALRGHRPMGLRQVRQQRRRELRESRQHSGGSRRRTRRRQGQSRTEPDRRAGSAARAAHRNGVT